MFTLYFVNLKPVSTKHDRMVEFNQDLNLLKYTDFYT